MKLLPTKRFLVDYSLVFSGFVLRFLGLIACQVILIRGLGAKELGYWSYLFGLFTLLGLCCDWGLGGAVGREVAILRDERDSRICAAAMARLSPFYLVRFCLITFLAVALSWLYVSPALLLPGLIGAVLGLGFALQVPLRDLLTGKRDSLGLAILSAGPHLVSCSVFLFCLATSTLSLTLAFLTLAFANSAVAVVLLIRSGAFGDVEPEMVSRIKDAMRRYGRGVSLGRIMGSGCYALDIPLLAFFRPPEEVAVYAAIKAVSMPFVVVSNISTTLVFRKLASFRRLPITYQALLGFYATAAGVVIIGFGPHVVDLLYGIDADLITLALLGQAFAIAAQIAYRLYGKFLHAQGDGTALGYGGMTFGLLFVVFNLTLIPYLGFTGACIASALSNASWLGFCFVCYRRTVLRPVAGESSGLLSAGDGTPDSDTITRAA
jgi:O-antigen/teichoic acid export membrane protein